MLCGDKNNALLPFFNHVSKQKEQQSNLVDTARAKELHLQILRQLCLDIKPNQCRVLQAGACKIHQQFWQGCGKEQGLALLRKPGEQLVELLGKAHFKQTVSFVKDDVPASVR